MKSRVSRLFSARGLRALHLGLSPWMVVGMAIILGLAITARLAELMGARLSVDSLPGVGSTFNLRVPRKHQESLREWDDATGSQKGSINNQPNPETMAA